MVKGQQIAKSARSAPRKSVVKSTGTPLAAGDARLPDCVACGVLVTAECRALRCDGCLGDAAWKCSDCLGLTPDVYGALVNGAGPELQWLCEVCRAGQDRVKQPDAVAEKLDNMAELLTKFLDRLLSIEEKVAKMAEKEQLERLEAKVAERDQLEKLEARVTNCEEETKHRQLGSDLEERLIKIEALLKNDKVEELLERNEERQQQLITDKQEQEEIEKRKNCLIVHGVTESVSDKADVRLEDDILKIADMMKEIGVDSVKVTKVIRLGKKSPSSDEAKPRPLKIVTETESQKWELLKSAKNLKHSKEGDWSRVYLHPDLTLKQREQRKGLLKEIAERKEKGETDLIIYRGRIVKKIVPQD
jgi:hypothetical protein